LKTFSFALHLVDMDTNPETVPDPDRQALHGFETGKMMQIRPDLYSDPQHTISHAHYAVQLCVTHR
jgi:hypothetical protein